MTHRQTDTLTDRQTDTLKDRQTDTLTDRQTDWHTDRQTDWHTDRQTDTLTHRQTDTLRARETDRQTDTQTVSDRHVMNAWDVKWRDRHWTANSWAIFTASITETQQTDAVLGLWQTHKKLTRETCTCVIPTCSNTFLVQVSHIKQIVFHSLQETRNHMMNSRTVTDWISWVCKCCVLLL